MESCSKGHFHQNKISAYVIQIYTVEGIAGHCAVACDCDDTIIFSFQYFFTLCFFPFFLNEQDDHTF